MKLATFCFLKHNVLLKLCINRRFKWKISLEKYRGLIDAQKITFTIIMSAPAGTSRLMV